VSTKKITRGLIYSQASEGLQAGPLALTKTATAVIEGETLANRQYLATGRGPWNKKSGYRPVIMVNGVVSGCVVTGGASTDNLETTAGVVNVNGVAVSVSADTSNAVTRGAAGKYVVHALCVDAAGTLSVVAGSPGDSLDLAGGFGGAGQKPLVAVTLAVLKYAVTLGATAAVIPVGDLYEGENANISVRIDALRGGIILYEALPLNHAGNVSRAIYATFYDLTTALVPVGMIEEAVLTVKKSAPIETPNGDSAWTQFVALPTLGWSLSVKRWREDQFWADKMLDPLADEFYLKMTEDVADAYSWYGYGILSGDYSVSTKRGPVSESLMFTGNGEVRRV
jgi:hypothetical protein